MNNLPDDILTHCVVPLLSVIDCIRFSLTCKTLYGKLKYVGKPYRECRTVNGILREASLEGHLDVVQYAVEKGAKNFNYALRYACEGGHMDVINWLVDEKGANRFNDALWGACQGGHMDIAKWFVDEKGATYFNNALRYAYHNDHMDIAEWLEGKINEK